MLSGEGNAAENGIGLISKRETLHVQRTFFVHFFAVVFHDYNVKLPGTSQLQVLCRECRTFYRSFFFFFHCRSFSLFVVAASISHFLTTATKFSWCSPNKKMSPLFFTLALDLCHLFFSMTFAGLPPTSHFLFLSLSPYSKFAGMIINLRLILQTTLIQKQFPLSVFVFIDSLINCLCFTRGGWLRLMAMQFPAKITSSCIWVAIPVE